jgi:DNA integrity scanning protein DisA with diadenylate cyclase activity
VADVLETRSMQRLADELDEDGVELPDDESLRHLIVDELDYVRRPPVHETRRPMYGSFILPPDRSLLMIGDLAELQPLDDVEPMRFRQFADGRSAFVVQRPGAGPALAHFRRSVQYEADLVGIQQATGAYIVQRTAFGVARLVTPVGVVDWNGRAWARRFGAAAMLDPLRHLLTSARPEVLEGLLELCIHWLSPSNIGATMLLWLVDEAPLDDPATRLDLTAAFAGPSLSVREHHHFAAIYAAQMQTDLATIVDGRGRVGRFAVGLNSSLEADELVSDRRGMRHRSARRYTYDHPETVAFVVSEDGPVTVFSDGAPIIALDVTHAEWMEMKHDPASEIALQRCVRCDKLLASAHVDVPFGIPSCPVCGTTDGLESRRVVAVKKEWPHRLVW